ncbi:hypothetical protein [Kribbella solani]|uniref:Uncharacterized protein n=1 Tax=Kribbella solani TaxID=236067 RepID=A0A841E113_9ACTN|nr:hypothetical protein [Kribbella solani]MBB5983891.1 hypothetical protein [Kribbella solani]
MIPIAALAPTRHAMPSTTRHAMPSTTHLAVRSSARCVVLSAGDLAGYLRRHLLVESDQVEGEW